MNRRHGPLYATDANNSLGDAADRPRASAIRGRDRTLHPPEMCAQFANGPRASDLEVPPGIDNSSASRQGPVTLRWTAGPRQRPGGTGGKST